MAMDSLPHRAFLLVRGLPHRARHLFRDSRAAATTLIFVTVLAGLAPYRIRMLLGGLAVLLGCAHDGMRGGLVSAGIVTAGVGSYAVLTQGALPADWLWDALALGILAIALGGFAEQPRESASASGWSRREPYGVLVNLMQEGLMVVDLDESVMFANDACGQMLGYLPGELVGKNLSELTSPEQFEVYRQKTRERREGRSDRYEARLLRKDGSVVEVLVSGTPFTTPDGTVEGVIGVFWDITERKREEEKLKYLSLHDALTGVFNRAFFEQEMRRVSDPRYLPISMVVCDVDCLKGVNDARGHPAGDDVLVRTAGIIRSAVRSSDVVARIGGDEFAVILPNTDAEAVQTVCDRIQRRVEADDRLCTGLSVGVATRETMTMSMAELFKTADDAMYAGKPGYEAPGKAVRPRDAQRAWARSAGRSRDVR